MSKVAVNGIEIEYQRYGPDSNEANSIVFANGAGGNLLSWFQKVPYFSRKYDCVVFSHRGFGHSYYLDNGPGMESFSYRGVQVKTAGSGKSLILTFYFENHMKT